MRGARPRGSGACGAGEDRQVIGDHGARAATRSGALREPRAALAATFASLREVLAYAWHMARIAHLGQVAASLTFSSVLALVPLLAVALAILTVLPVFDHMRQNLEQALLKGLLPAGYAQTLLRYLTEFVAKAGGVGAAGLLFLAGSALSMMLTVDRILNDIWQVHRRRTLARRVLVYAVVLSVGPILLALSLSLASYLGQGGASLLPGHRKLLGFASPFVAAIAYGATYTLVPNRKVAWYHALAGGAFTALADELMSRAFAAYVAHGALLSIYGAFAAVPVFLIWIYALWLSFLFGASIAATLPQLRATRLGDVRRAGNRALTAVAIVKALYDARQDGRLRALSTAELTRLLRTDEERLTALLLQLQDLGYVHRLELSGGAPDEWVLACDPQTQGLAPLFHSLVLDPRNSLLQRADLHLERWIGPVVEGEWLVRGLAQLDYRPPTAGPGEERAAGI